MILTVTLNPAIDKSYVVEEFKEGEVNRVKECACAGGQRIKCIQAGGGSRRFCGGHRICGRGHAGNYIEESLADYHVKGVISII